MSTALALIGAIALLVTAGYHLTGLREISSDISGGRLGLTRAAWIGIALDWVLLAVAWMAAALGFLPAIILTVSSALPIAAALLLVVTLGIKFPGVWLLGLAGAFAFAAGAI